MRLVLRFAGTGGGPHDFDVVLDQHAILQDGDRCRLQQLAGVIEAWGVIDNVVSLPLARRAARVDQRGVLLVNRAGLAVVIGLVGVVNAGGWIIG